MAVVFSMVNPGYTFPIFGSLSNFVNKTGIEEVAKDFSFSELKNFSDRFTPYIPSITAAGALVATYGLQPAAIIGASAYSFLGMISMYRALKEVGDHSHSYSYTPLMHSVISLRDSNTSVLESLLTRGADANLITDKCGENVLMLAIQYTRSEAKAFAISTLARFTDVNARNRGYFGQWFFSCRSGSCDASALHMAVKYASSDVVEVLKRNGANINATTSWFCGSQKPIDMKPMDEKSIALLRSWMNDSGGQGHTSQGGDL